MQSQNMTNLMWKGIGPHATIRGDGKSTAWVTDRVAVSGWRTHMAPSARLPKHSACSLGLDRLDRELRLPKARTPTSTCPLAAIKPAGFASSYYAPPRQQRKPNPRAVRDQTGYAGQLHYLALAVNKFKCHSSTLLRGGFYAAKNPTFSDDGVARRVHRR